jgi:hypothetical protein
MTLRSVFCALLGLAAIGFTSGLRAQSPIDSDHDGLSDAIEDSLLRQFEPRFMMGEHDCSVRPAEFRTGATTPVVEADNGTIYGQVFPLKDAAGAVAEVHYYHLWRTDCGSHGHPLDTEHVAVLVRASGTPSAEARWKAVYWYAAAHENTVCDVSQIARASTLDAEDHGATVWISPGKHASYLNETLCRGGCGADRCEKTTELPVSSLINLGEADAPMNGSAFIGSARWPLRAKMVSSNFPAAAVARLEGLPPTDIAWFVPGRHPMQGVIARSGSTASAISLAGDSTSRALDTASDSTDGALSDTGSAIHRGYRNTMHALGSSARHVGKALGAGPKKTGDEPK